MDNLKLLSYGVEHFRSEKDMSSEAIATHNITFFLIFKIKNIFKKI